MDLNQHPQRKRKRKTPPPLLCVLQTDDPTASQTGTGDGTGHKKHHRVEDLLGAGAIGVAGYETYKHFEKKG
jgi:hypothetical protein